MDSEYTWIFHRCLKFQGLFCYADKAQHWLYYYAIKWATKDLLNLYLGRFVNAASGFADCNYVAILPLSIFSDLKKYLARNSILLHIISFNLHL